MEVAARQVFLSHATEDEAQVLELHEKLSGAGLRPWRVAKDVLPGENADAVAADAMRRSAFFLAVLSKTSTARSGRYEREWELGLEVQAERAADAVYLIPVRLEPCDVPKSLARIVSVDLFRPDGWERLLAALQRSRGAALPPPEPPADLVAALKKGDCVLFVGAGLGRPAGLPLWRELVSEILDLALREQVIDTTLAQSFKISLGDGGADSVADSLTSLFRERFPKGGPLEEFLRDRFLAAEIGPTPYHRELPRIKPSAALTTNFDDLLEATFHQPVARIFTARDAEKLLDSLAQPDRFFILKLVGTPDRPESLLVSPRQFSDAVAADPLFRQFFERLFFSRTVLFLGSSLAGIQSNLDALQPRSTTSPQMTQADFPGRSHYALVGVTGQEWRAQADVLTRRYNVQVLPYALGDPAEVQDDALAFLKALPTQAARARRSASRKAARLRRVVLENIGPFEHLDMELDPTWNVLLGDNGVGKSNILRAIALALCGDAAGRLAARSLRYGTRRGRVSLETTDGDQRVVELRRASRLSDDVVVRLQATRDLEAQPGLAIGFPALRQLGWQPVTGPEPKPATAYTTPEDLLPLLRDEPDPRMQGFKQSIVNLDLLRSQTGGDERSRARAAQQFDALFHVVQEMAEGVTLRYVGYDSKTSQVLVMTDDGKVPIEMVSQGTQSLMGWVGVVLERLFDVYPDAAQPQHGYALVAIDEIDAHMHPGWQQTIVPSLAELFPDLQVIATSHSPLIVGDLERTQVHVLSRDPETRQISAVRPSADFDSYRADQMLTSPLFGLVRTRSRKFGAATDRFSELLSKPNRTAEEEAEFATLRAKLHEETLAGSTPAERSVEGAVRKVLEQTLAAQKGARQKAQVGLPEEFELALRRQIGALLGRREDQR